MEAQFLTANITVDDTKYNYVIQCLDEACLAEVSDIVLNPPAADKYHALKDRLDKSFADSAEKKLRRLLNEIDLGDRRPSQLLRRMRDLAQSGVSKEVLKSLWLQRLPQQVQAILTATKYDLEELSQLADRVTDVLPAGINVVTAATSKQTLPTDPQCSQISALIERVEKLETRASRSRSRTPQGSGRGSYSRSSSGSQSDSCWYHRRFGSKANRCTKPCDTRADVSTLPVSKRNRSNQSDHVLYAANRTIIPTFGQKLLKLDLGFRWTFQWPFVIANVDICIIGSDFLAHFNLLPDIRHKRLIDGNTLIKVSAQLVKQATPRITTLAENCPFKEILSKFPEVTKTSIIHKETAHGVEHVIETTGSLVSAKAR
ncbi:uncharacterized protein LOC120359942 [Solenopsis invicta]|uniref:uncharacterized protein LOC105202564 n=1 Tax=Solenopsis invicta TaxID=13686 RepID=UPI000E33E634|nr:uncharacterized protein LOC105202564 [Solenopsis invicta]XP_039315353.1 uncharacterized protein LOC120359942 [Solenopsis invicta]